MKTMGVEEGIHVADIGCHQGYMTVKLAKKVGKKGRVYAVDINNYQLKKLKENLQKRELQDVVEIIKGDNDDPKLPVSKLDAAIILDSYHEMDSYEEILLHIKKALKPGGRLVIVEPIADQRNGWSRKKQAEKHEISIRYVIKDLKNAGFELIQDITPFIDRTKQKGDKMWMLVAKKPDNGI